MIDWRAKLMGLAVACGLAAGCARPVYLAERDLHAIADHIPANLEKDVHEAIIPTVGPTPTPPDVNNPDGPPQYISLEQAIAMGLENGNTSSRLAGRAGEVEDLSLASFTRGQFGFESESVRVLRLQPAEGYTNIETQLSRFDAQWITSINFQTTDSLQQGLQSFQNGNSTSFASSFVKALPTGGTANISFLTDYRLLSSPPTGSFGVLNPSYTSRLIFGFDHPLWKDYGVDINQMIERQPGSSTFSPIPGVHQGAVGQRRALATQFFANDGILVARIKYDQRKAEFERQINGMVLQIETAYWNQLSAQGRLASSTLVLDIALKLWAQSLQRLNVGAIAPPEFYQVDGLVHELRVQRQTALADVIEAERQLRRLTGMPLVDGTRLVLITPPTKAKYQPNFEAAVTDALTLRPEMTLAREELRISHIKLLLAKNLLKPDLHFAAQYSPAGYGTRLDGAGVFKDEAGKEHPSNAFRSLASTHFNDWNIGLILNVPLGYRAEMANIRAARLSLAQQYFILKEHEDRAKAFVTQQYQQVSKWYSLIEMRIAQRKAYKNSADKQIESYTAGRSKLDVNLVDAIRRFAEALNGEYDAVSQYNITLARFEWGKGTILHNNNVFLSDGVLPECAHERAVDHERRRTQAHVLHNPPRPLATLEGEAH